MAQAFVEGTLPKAQTYLLVGASLEAPKVLKDAETLGIKVIHSVDYPSIAEAAKAIKADRDHPVNIILDAHGGTNASFTWAEDGVMNFRTDPYYAELFKNLPREGIQSITINNCYGGVVQNSGALAFVPAGTVVQTLVSDKNLSFFYRNEILAAVEQSTQSGLFLQALNQFNPKQYVDGVMNWNKHEISEGRSGEYNADPVSALPKIIGLGGGWKMDLNKETSALSAGLKNGTVDLTIWSNAVSYAKSELYQEFRYTLHDIDSKRDFENVVGKMQRGEPLGTDSDRLKAATELRAAYALTASYMALSGQMAELSEKAKIVQENAATHYQPVTGGDVADLRRQADAVLPLVVAERLRSERKQAERASFELEKAKLDRLAREREAAAAKPDTGPGKPIAAADKPGTTPIALPAPARASRAIIGSLRTQAFSENEIRVIKEAQKNPKNRALIRQEQDMLEAHGFNTGKKNHAHDLFSKPYRDETDGIRGKMTKKAEAHVLEQFRREHGPVTF